MRSRRTLLVAVALVLAACTLVHAQTPVVRVLFIGNSYTYANNLPQLFAGLAAGHAKVETAMAAPGGWRLKDHWEKGNAHQVLRSRKWDYVVLQDQSQLGVNYFVNGRPRVDGDEIFRPYADRWAKEIRGAGATPVFYLTWARKASPEDQDALNYAYISAAQRAHAVVAPVGIAWADLRRHHPEIELYQSDGSHPSPAGSYLAALVMYASIVHFSPMGLAPRAGGTPINLHTGQPEPDKGAVLVDLPPEEAQTLQAAADDACRGLQQHGGYPDVHPPPAPAPPPLSPGELLSSASLEGTWSGDFLFYPGVGSVRMILGLHREGGVWKGHLAINYPVKDFANESMDLVDLKIGDREITFSDPSSAGVARLKVDFRGIYTAPGELRGTAEARRTNPDVPPVVVLGEWKLRQQR